ncbi:chorismate-binding protein [Mangrovicoccus ximenensis]|uniref:chorismate-binding protein n=1 Tax=Mangrovicoccus ximenensis TaxID=1911570 RepID=UPI001F172061|nr:chorismate-binding protein [Mangrovicoccus ximenensis]
MRQADPVADAAAAAGLAGSDKDRREHAIVVEYILDTLAPFCRSLGTPEGTRLTSTRSMWHLGTPIEGVLKDEGLPSAVLAARLHPTPAVCGLPCNRAEELIRKLEPVPRDYYAGAVGWTDAHGDGAWHVAIRCAEICGAEARLYAGAGIVPGSDPEAEVAETGGRRLEGQRRGRPAGPGGDSPRHMASRSRQGLHCSRAQLRGRPGHLRART